MSWDYFTGIVEMSSLAHRITQEKTLSHPTATDEQDIFDEMEGDDGQPIAESTHEAISEQKLAGNVALVTTGRLEVYPLFEGINTIGRDKDCGIRIEDPVVSRKHAKILLQGTQLILTDLLSTNGTYINGHRVTANTLLRGGDRIRLGRTEFVVAA